MNDLSPKNMTEQDYLTKFNAFLDSKIHKNQQKRSQIIPNQNNNHNLSTNKTVSSEINKRLSKLKQPSTQDRKINLIMQNFKKVETYVDIKDFIDQLREEGMEKK